MWKERRKRCLSVLGPYAFASVSARLKGHARQKGRWAESRTGMEYARKSSSIGKGTGTASFPSWWAIAGCPALDQGPDRVQAPCHPYPEFSICRRRDLVRGVAFQRLQQVRAKCRAPSKASTLQSIRDEFGNPEQINDSLETAPSKRVAGVLHGYQKLLMGVRVAKEIGIETIREACPQFGNWIDCLKSIARNQVRRALGSVYLRFRRRSFSTGPRKQCGKSYP